MEGGGDGSSVVGSWVGVGGVVAGSLVRVGGVVAGSVAGGVVVPGEAVVGSSVGSSGAPVVRLGSGSTASAPSVSRSNRASEPPFRARVV